MSELRRDSVTVPRQTPYGLEVLNKAARRCKGSEFKSGAELLEWGGISIFFMAEGN